MLNIYNHNDALIYIKNKLNLNICYKGHMFYKNLIKLYDLYPSIIKTIIDKIPKLTYYKDYFRILEESKNEELNNYIFNILLKTIKKDIYNYNNNLEISNLAKWLPRKNSYFDKKFNFVNKFSKLLFKTEENKKVNLIYCVKQYRLLVSKLTKKLNPIEINLCSKNYSNITQNSLTYKNFIKYNYTLSKKINFDYYTVFKKYLLNCNIQKLISIILKIYNVNNNKKYYYEHLSSIINDIWKNNFNQYLQDNININYNDTYLIIDFDPDMLNAKYIKNIFKLILFSLYTNKLIVINKNKPKLIKYNDDVFTIIDQIYSNINISNSININNINNVLNNDLPNNNLKPIIVTTKMDIHLKNNIINYKNTIINEKNYNNYMINKKLNINYINNNIVNYSETNINNYINNILFVCVYTFIIMYIYLLYASY